MTRKIRYKKSSPQLERLASPNFESSSRTSLGMEKFVGEFFYLDIKNLIPFRNQARRVFDPEEIEQLAKTIKEHGIRQPLTVLKSDREEGGFEVVSGERRLRAAKIAGLEKVPCMIMRDSVLAEEIAIIENIQRADLHPIELGRALSHLLENARWGSKGELAEKLGMKGSSLSEMLKFAELPNEISEKLLNLNLRSRELLRKISKASSVENMRIILGREAGIKIDKASHTTAQKPQDILRIRFDNNSFFTKKGKIEKLNQSNRDELKKIILDIFNQI